MNYSQVNEEALKRRAKRLAYKKAAEDCLGGAFHGTNEQPSDDEIKPGKYYMDGKEFDSMEDLMVKGFTQDEKDIMLGKNPYVKVRY